MLYIYRCADFMEIVSLVIFEALTDLGVECCLSTDVDRLNESSWLLFVSMFDRIQTPKHYIVYQTEPYMEGEQEDSLYFIFLKKAIQVWDYSQVNCDVLRKRGLDCLYVPFCYSRCMEIWNMPKDTPGDRPIDVLFIGNTTDHREKIIQNLSEFLSKNGKTSDFFMGSTLRGLEREKRIMSAKIHLVLQKTLDYSQFPQDISRIYLLAAKKCFMIRENFFSTLDSVEIAANVDEIKLKIMKFLESPDLIEQNVEKVYNEAKSKTLVEVFTNLKDRLALIG